MGILWCAFEPLQMFLSKMVGEEVAAKKNKNVKIICEDKIDYLTKPATANFEILIISFLVFLVSTTLIFQLKIQKIYTFILVISC